MATLTIAGPDGHSVDDATDSLRLSPAARVTERWVDGELVLHDGVKRRLHALNATASYVWVLCDGRRDEAQIIAELSALYPESVQAIAADVPMLMKTFVAEGLLVPVTS
jgi:hypothetical protein